ncbi:MAG: COX15/CtaA family protein [Planctomycetota bacterium]|jgi:cytochrome c oxidase assembly protein subunit 15
MTPDAGSTVPELTASQRAFRASAWLAALLTLVLIVVGGLVTSLEVGMSVPDWPTTEGAGMFEAKQADLTAEQRVEHTHRLLGATVGCATLLVLLCALIQPSRRLRVFAVVATVMVIGQGILGGLRVTENSVPFAMVHAGLAQIFFSLLICMAVASSRFWNALRPAAEGAPALGFAVGVAAMTYLQVLLGVLTRHLGPGAGTHAAITHVVGAGIVTIAVGMLAGGLMHHPKLKHFSTALLGILAVQVGLGMAAWAVAFTTDTAAATAASSVFLATAHQVLGAVLFAATVVTAFLIWKLRGAASAEAGTAPASPGAATGHEAAPAAQFAGAGA